MQDFYEFDFVSMTTPCKVMLYKVNEKKALRCFKEIKQNTLVLERKYNFYDKKSYLSRTINNRDKNKIKIDQQSANILKIVRNLSIATNNLFDITTGTLKQCYKKDKIEDVKKSLEEFIPKTGIDVWDIKNRFLEFKYSDTILDLGGVIKEYAVDEAAKIAQEHGIKSALINFGGDIFCLGEKEGNIPFSIGIKNPLNPQENLVIVELKNQGLTTSANYERSFSIENEDFSHILTKTKQQKDIISSTVISNSTLKSGIYSTSFMIDTNIEIPDDLKVVLVDKDLKLHQNIQI